MLKLIAAGEYLTACSQPPSGGCVLKQHRYKLLWHAAPPAAFRRLCVETASVPRRAGGESPAAFRRLCVETN